MSAGGAATGAAGGSAGDPQILVDGAMIPVYITGGKAQEIGFEYPFEGDRELLKMGDIICVENELGTWRVATVQSYDKKNPFAALAGKITGSAASTHTVIYGDQIGEPEEIFLNKTNDDKNANKKQWLIYKGEKEAERLFKGRAAHQHTDEVAQKFTNAQFFAQAAADKEASGDPMGAIGDYTTIVANIEYLLSLPVWPSRRFKKADFESRLTAYKARIKVLRAQNKQVAQLRGEIRDLEPLKSGFPDLKRDLVARAGGAGGGASGGASGPGGPGGD